MGASPHGEWACSRSAFPWRCSPRNGPAPLNSPFPPPRRSPHPPPCDPEPLAENKQLHVWPAMPPLHPGQSPVSMSHTGLGCGGGTGTGTELGRRVPCGKVWPEGKQGGGWTSEQRESFRKGRGGQTRHRGWPLCQSGEGMGSRCTPQGPWQIPSLGCWGSHVQGVLDRQLPQGQRSCVPRRG